jgi:hypothetical protein
MTFKDSRRCGTGYPEWICPEHRLTCTQVSARHVGLLSVMSTGIKSRRRRKRYKEWEKRALTGVAEGDDSSDTRGVILIVAE